MKSLRDLFLDELSEIYDAEQRIIEALPNLIESANSKGLQSALYAHLRETEAQAERLESVFAAFDEPIHRKRCPAMSALLEEADEIVVDNIDFPTANAAIISAVQKVKHHEIASYGCLTAWAVLLGNAEASGILGEILDEEKGADRDLNEHAAAQNVEALELAAV